MKISVIIIDYNTATLTENLVASIYKHTDISSFDHEIIIVDNNPCNSNIKYFHRLKLLPRVRLIKQKINNGFGAGNNVAAASADGDVLFFLNPDTYFQKNESFFQTLTANFQRFDQTGIIAPKVLNPDGALQSLGNSKPNLVSLFFEKALFSNSNMMNRLRVLSLSPRGLFKTRWVSGCAFAMRNEDFKKAGGFDENIFMYGEDVDLNLKVQNRLGKHCFVDDSVSIIHIRGASSGSKYKSYSVAVAQAENIHYVFRKHHIFSFYPLVVIIFLINMLLHNLKEWVKLLGTGNENLN